MVSGNQLGLLAGIAEWLNRESTVRAVVLFGSRARAADAPAAADGWSDYDLQVLTTAPERLISADWQGMIPGRLCMRVLRPATSGVRKLTLLSADGEIDLVIVPLWKMQAVKFAMVTGLHRRVGVVEGALNNLSTIMSGGFLMLKGAREWAPFYERVVREMPGFRLSDIEVCSLADAFVCDLHWVFQKLQRGELVAAQRTLHRSLIETNIVLVHEARIRAKLPTFQQARRVEQLLPMERLRSVQIDARLDREELSKAARIAWAELQSIMHELVPAWRITPAAADLLSSWNCEGDRKAQA